MTIETKPPRALDYFTLGNSKLNRLGILSILAVYIFQAYFFACLFPVLFTAIVGHP
jgi:hypothetical protein